MKQSRELSPTETKIAESLPYLDVDEIWRTGGWIGRYQIIQLLIVTWYTASAAFHLFAYIFISYEPPHICKTSENITDYFDRGNMSLDVIIEECSIIFHHGNQTVGDMDCVLGHNYSAPKTTSILSEWDYVCAKRDLGQLPQSLFIAGQGLGALLIQVADYIGRRKTLIVSQVLMFILTFGQAFVQHFWILAALRFFTGAVQQGVVLSAVVYLMELFPTNRRVCVITFEIISWSLHLLLLGAIAYLLRDYGWRTLEITLSFTGLHAIVLFFFMEESLRWLIVKERTEDSVKLLKKIARVNKIYLEKILLADKRVKQMGEKIELMMNDRDEVDGDLSNLKGEPTVTNSQYPNVVFKKTREDRERNKKSSNAEGLCIFFRDPRLLFQSSIIWFSWFVNVLVYFGLYTMPSLTIKDRFLQFTLMAAIELLSAIILAIALVKLKRKTIYVTLHLIGGVALLLASMLFSVESVKRDVSPLITLLSSIGKLSTGTSFYFLFLYSSELFPTYMRNTGIGVASFCGRIGGIIAPFTFTLAKAIPWAPGVVFGTCCIVVGVLVKFVSETSDKPLPQRTKDIKSWRLQTEPVDT